MAYYGNIENPLTEALEMLCGSMPLEISQRLLGIAFTKELSEEAHEAVYDWATANTKLRWATGCGVLDAADVLVWQAYENDNITGEWRSRSENN